MAGSASVTLRAVLIPRPTHQHLATTPTADDGTVTELAEQLRENFGAHVTVLDRRFLASPAIARTALAKRMAGPADELLLIVSGYVAGFTRRDGGIWTLALPGSVPGRPRSMLPLRALADTAIAAARGRALMISLNAAPLPGSADRKPTSAELADVLTAPRSPALADRPDVLVTLDDSATAGLGLHAVERTLAAAASQGQSARPGGIALQAAEFARSLGSDATATAGSRGPSFTPLRQGPSLPEYIRDDLFASDPGSRMDAALELAALASAGHLYAPRELNRLAARDRAADVRAYADLLARRGIQPALEELLATGRIPVAAYSAAKESRHLPEFVAGPTGPVPIGVDAPDGEPGDRPRHTVDLTPYRLSRTPVTDRQYLAFLTAVGGPCPDHWATAADLWDGADHPVVMVSFHDALRYCTWLDSLLRGAGLLTDTEHITLPAEAQWEAAAGNGRGDRHPWGPEPDPTRCNIRATGIGRPSPIGAFSPHGDTDIGISDLIGNVWEWTSSAWGASYRQPAHRYPYDSDDGREDQQASGVRRVIRGGAFYYATDCANNHTRNRIPPGTRHPGGGFRVATAARSHARETRHQDPR